MSARTKVSCVFEFQGGGEGGEVGKKFGGSWGRGLLEGARYLARPVGLVFQRGSKGVRAYGVIAHPPLHLKKNNLYSDVAPNEHV